MIIPMIILDIVSNLRSNGFCFNLVMKSEENNVEPFVVGTMELAEVKEIIQGEMTK